MARPRTTEVPKLYRINPNPRIPNPSRPSPAMHDREQLRLAPQLLVRARPSVEWELAGAWRSVAAGCSARRRESRHTLAAREGGSARLRARPAGGGRAANLPLRRASPVGVFKSSSC